MTKPAKCIFCGEQPLVYFTHAGNTAFFPVINMHIKCEKCGIDTWSVVCHDEDSFKSIDKAKDNLIEQWNRENQPTRCKDVVPLQEYLDTLPDPATFREKFLCWLSNLIDDLSIAVRKSKKENDDG